MSKRRSAYLRDEARRFFNKLLALAFPDPIMPKKLKPVAVEVKVPNPPNIVKNAASEDDAASDNDEKNTSSDSEEECDEGQTKVSSSEATIRKSPRFAKDAKAKPEVSEGHPKFMPAAPAPHVLERQGDYAAVSCVCVKFS